MVTSKKKMFLRLGVFLLAVFITGMCSAGSSLALEEGKYYLYDQNSIWFYDPDASANSNCVEWHGGGSGISLSGGSRVEKVWNYIVDLGISGLSDNPAAIAGVVGNMSVESGFDPFIQNSGGCTGIIQWCKGSWNDGFFSYMRNKGFDNYYHVGGGSRADEATINDGLLAELDFLFRNGTGGVTASKYISNLGVPSSKSGVSGARAYSDLFLVTVENAFGGSDSLEDPGVKGIAGHSTYQAAEKRRGSAESYYNMYGNGGGGGGEDEEEEDEEDGGEREFCKDNSDEGGDEDDYDEPETGNLASYVKSWAWPTYEKNKTEQMPAYKSYMSTQATYKGDCSGNDCGAFVANIIKASGWDSRYPQCNTDCQRTWLAANWKNVSSEPRKLGDVGIRSGHVILYVGSIPGFNSNTASASQCDRAPMAGRDSNFGQYTWYRRR